MARIDALSKVLGEKIFVRDLRASDIRSLPHGTGEDWGDVTWHALLLRAGYLDRTFLGLNQQALGNYQPIKCFLRQGNDFVNVMDEREKYALDFGFVLFGRGLEISLFVDQGSKPDYTGQPVALLIFDDIRHFLNAEREQPGIRDLVEYDALPLSEIPHAYNVVDPTSAALDNWLENDVIPPDDQLYGGQGVALGKSASAWFPNIEKSFNQGQIVQFRSTTPTIDPCFLEPDSSLGRVRRLADGKYHLTLYAPTQSPATDEGGINGILARNITPSNIDLRCDIIGGGFGGRDFSIFPFYGAIDSLVSGQVEGGFAQGLGYAIMEHMPQGPLGGQRLTNFHNYAIPRLQDIPRMETVFVDMPEGEHILQPIGDKDPAPPPKIRRKGIAEISITSVAPAIANAVFHALSGLPNGGTVKTRPSQLPMTPAIIRQCVKEAE